MVRANLAAEPRVLDGEVGGDGLVLEGGDVALVQRGGLRQVTAPSLQVDTTVRQLEQAWHLLLQRLQDGGRMVPLF